jgi:MFS family permease
MSSGAGVEMWQTLLGRAIAGIGGGAGASLVSIVIGGTLYSIQKNIGLILQDLVPVRSIAAWRSYVNIAATAGRSFGGPIGGSFTDSVGWRWYERMLASLKKILITGIGLSTYNAHLQYWLFFLLCGSYQNQRKI